MSEPCKHPTKRGVLGREGGDGEPIYGMPPASDEEPAWCAYCGALWCKTGFGWGWLSPRADASANTFGNLMNKKLLEREAENVGRIRFVITLKSGRQMRTEFIRKEKIAELLGARDGLGAFLMALVGHAKSPPPKRRSDLH